MSSTRTTYPVIAEPPLFDGAAHRTVAEALPDVGEPIVGAPGNVGADGGTAVAKPASTRRIAALPDSAITKPPAGVVATAYGNVTLAAVAGPPSPSVKTEGEPVPATVVITPVGETHRTRLPNQSAIRKPPSRVTASPVGSLSCAAVAAPP